MKTPIYLASLFLICLIACTPNKNPQTIIDEAIKMHGGALLIEKSVSFEFREKAYSTRKENGQTIYTRSFFDDSLGQVKDVLVNSTSLKRYVNDTLVNLDAEWEKKYTSSINSVLYFFQLQSS